MSAFGLLRQSDFWHHAQRMLCMVRIDGCAQILKPAPGRLIRNRGLTWLDGSQPIVLIRGTCRPVDEIAAELGFELADGFVTEEVVQIKQADQQQVVLRPGTLVVFVFGAFRYLVSGQDVGYGEDGWIGCADCGCVLPTNIGFERFRSDVNVIAAAPCADLLAPVEDDPGFAVLSEPE